jgi:hypothetical protein
LQANPSSAAVQLKRTRGPQLSLFDREWFKAGSLAFEG